jgi:preprotein translocase subunit SecF
MRLFANANYDFLGQRRIAFGTTLSFIFIGLLVLVIRGVNYSVEFTGGTLLQVQTTKAADVAALRSALQARGIDNAEIQTFGSDREIAVRARVAREGSDANDTQATAGAVREAFNVTLGAGNYQILRTEAVGPKVGSELRLQAVLAILMSFLAVLAYLAYRFEWRFGIAAVVATMHDVVASLAFIGLARLEVSLFVVAGLLTIVGYSLNDTIVIFDRIRENLHKRKRDSFESVINRSINETLPRTFFTGTTALGSLIALSVLGGDVVRPFALLMLFGVVVGTFSSIYIASPVLLAIETRWPGPDARGHLGSKTTTTAPPSRKPQPVG